MTMEMTVPEDCGNSPRMTIVAEFVTAWAQGEEAAVQEWLHEDIRWVLVGQGRTPTSGEDGGDASAGTGSAACTAVPPPFAADCGEVLTVLNHGRLAACDGYLMRGDQRVDFCHVLRFAGTTKTALIREIRTFLQPSAAGQPTTGAS